MSLTTNEMGAADIAAITGGNRGYGNGFNDDIWIIILFLIFFGNGNWNNGNGSGGFVTADIQRGFDQSAVISGLTALQGAVNTGFGDTALAIAGLNQGMCSGFAQVENAANNRQMANMNQAFAAQTAIAEQLNNMAMIQQSNCYENRAAVADLKYTIATEACADRAAIQDGIQVILDKMCQQENEALKTQNTNLQTQLLMRDLAASQNAQTDTLKSDNAAQTQYVVNRVAPYPVPSYTVANPYAYNNNCGCGMGIA